jgi:hypothetical protein
MWIMYKRLKIIIQNNNIKVITQSIPSQPKKMKTAKQNKNQQHFKIFRRYYKTKYFAFYVEAFQDYFL